MLALFNMSFETLISGKFREVVVPKKARVELECGVRFRRAPQADAIFDAVGKERVESIFAIRVQEGYAVSLWHS